MTEQGQSFWSPLALLPDGWATGVRVDCDAAGTITTVRPNAPSKDCHKLSGPALPGLPNLHSHAFQRAMAGLTERVAAGRAAGRDDFWSWRKTMYGFVKQLTPPQVEAIAAQLYVEMLKAGYTGVAEFHYLHNPPGGGRYGDPAELSKRIVAGAAAAGIRLTLLPVLYQDGGFGGEPINDAQQRFRLEVDEWAALIAAMTKAGDASQSAAAALHSLRAVAPASLNAAVAAYRTIRADGPIHIHIAEQEKEVADCVAWSGQRPVAFLMDTVDIDQKWILVHATHLSDAECAAATDAGVIAGLCPTTEANLGDGIFGLPAWLEAGGGFGIGSDSNVSLDPREELRWLEYAQRLARKQRLVVNSTAAVRSAGQSLGPALWQGALHGGATAMGQPCAGLAVGQAADFLVLNADHPSLAGHTPETLLDAWIFSNIGSALRDVWVAGRHVIKQGRHKDEEAIAGRYRQVMKTLLEGSH